MQGQQTNQFKQVGDFLAQFGRADDQFIAHVAPGEAVIPQPLFQDPELREMFWRKLEEHGIDPTRYIIGHDTNSINPATGLPEFGFFSDLWKGVKKVGKAVAPIALPIAAPFLLPAMAPALASGIGSFAGNMIAGADAKDALKAAAITGGAVGLGGWLGGKLGGGAGANAAKVGDAVAAGNPATISGQLPSARFAPGGGAAAAQELAQQGATSMINPTTGAQAGTPSFWESIKKTMTPGDGYGITDLYKDQLSPSRASAADSNALVKWGPLAAAGIGGLALADTMMRPPPQAGIGFDGRTGWDELQRDPGRYGFHNQLFFGDNPHYQHLRMMTPAYMR